MPRTRFLILALFGLALAGLAAPGPARAGAPLPAGAAEAAAIRAVIGAQLEAFRRDDGSAAFSYASPAIRRMFGTVDRFMAMVRGGYPAVYRPRQVEFRETLVRDGVTVQTMRLVGPDGAAVLALYFMERQPDGSWRINGVTLLHSDDGITS